MPQFLNKDIKELIWRMMTVDPSKRITIQEIKENPWFRSNNSDIIQMPSPFVEDIVSRILIFSVHFTSEERANVGFRFHRTRARNTSFVDRRRSIDKDRDRS